MRDAAIGLALAGLTFLLTVIWGGPLNTLLKRYRIGKLIRIDEPQRRQVKTGTPTLGGLLVVVPVLLITLLLNVVNLISGSFNGRSVLLPLAVLTVYTLLGAYDDWLGLSGVSRGEGLRGLGGFIHGEERDTWQLQQARCCTRTSPRSGGSWWAYLPSAACWWGLRWGCRC